MLNNVICAIDALGSATSTADNSLPAFPEENPDQVALATWLDKWDAYVASQGYMPMLSGKDPTGVVHLIEQDLSDYPVIAPAADGSNAQQVSTRAAKRADVIHHNNLTRCAGLKKSR